MATAHPLNLVLFSFIFVLNFFSIPLSALNIGVETTGVAVSVVRFLIGSSIYTNIHFNISK